MLKFVTRPGSAVQITIAALAAAGGLLWVTTATVSHAKAATPTDQDVALWLARAGLDPTALAVAGVAAETVDDVVADGRDYLDTGLANLQQADEEVSSALASAQSLERLVQTGQASPQQISALPGALSVLDTARATLESRLAALRAAATEPLAQGQPAAIAVFRAARLQGWDLPDKYLPMTQTQEQRIALRNALAHKRTAERYGQQVSASATTTINTANADPAVVAAAQGLANLAPVTTAWNSAVFQ